MIPMRPSCPRYLRVLFPSLLLISCGTVTPYPSADQVNGVDGGERTLGGATAEDLVGELCYSVARDTGRILTGGETHAIIRRDSHCFHGGWTHSTLENIRRGEFQFPLAILGGLHGLKADPDYDDVEKWFGERKEAMQLDFSLPPELPSLNAAVARLISDVFERHQEDMVFSHRRNASLPVQLPLHTTWVKFCETSGRQADPGTLDGEGPWPRCGTSTQTSTCTAELEEPCGAESWIVSFSQVRLSRQDELLHVEFFSATRDQRRSSVGVRQILGEWTPTTCGEPEPFAVPVVAEPVAQAGAAPQHRISRRPPSGHARALRAARWPYCRWPRRGPT